METSIVIPEFVDARVAPSGALESLSQEEIEQLLSTGQGGLYPLFRACALAVLNAGSDTDNARDIFDKFRDFEVQILRHAWGVRLDIRNAPAQAFVDGRMIRGTQELLFAVLRDVVYTANEIVNSGRFDLSLPTSITTPGYSITSRAPIWWCVGAGTRSTESNTSTPSGWVISWV
jgi:pyrimidine/purine-5'-nucleotide nucleosidase